jgi:hypothetical protein
LYPLPKTAQPEPRLVATKAKTVKAKRRKITRR